MTSDRSSRRALALVAAALLVGAPLVACSFVQSLDYLQAGLGDDASAPDATAGDGGGDGAASAVVVVVPGQTSPDLLAQDATTLYWLSNVDLMSAPKGGGAPKKLATVGGVVHLAVDRDPSGSVYAAIGSDVVAVPKQGGAPAAVFKGAGADASIPTNTVALDDASLFVLQYDDNEAIGIVRRMAKDGGAQAILDSDSGASALAVDDKAALWFDEARLGWYELPKGAAPGGGSLHALGPGGAEIVATAQSVALDADTVYWVDSDDNGNAVIRSRKRAAAGTQVTIHRGGLDDQLVAIAPSGTWIYAVDSAANHLFRVPKVGGTREILATGLQQPTSLVIDDAFVYLTETSVGAQGRIVKIALPK